MNSAKQNKIVWQLDNRLDLSRNPVSIDSSASYYEEKNSPMYNDSISPLYKKEEEYEHRIVLNTRGDRFHYASGVLYMNDQPIMHTDGEGWFERKEVEHDYDTYDIDDDHNEVWSVYDHGIISYHTPKGEYSYACEDPLSAVIDCRARIVDGAPIIAYVLAQSSGRYEFVYLRDEIQYHRAAVKNVLKARLTCTEITSTKPNQERDKAANNQTIIEEDSEGYIKWRNPLIQIASPLPEVYVVSFITDHGSKLKPSEVGFINILENHGEFYDSIEYDTSESLIESSDTLTTVARFKSSVSHELTSQTVYCYVIPSGNPEWDAKHSADVGKWYRGTTSNGIDQWLTDEVVFDPGYDPKEDPNGGWIANDTDYYQTGSGTSTSSTQYTKWSRWTANTYTDRWTCKATVEPITRTDTSLDIAYTVNPLTKVIHKGEESWRYTLKADTLIDAINEQLAPEGRTFARFEYQTLVNGTNKAKLPDGTEEVLGEEWLYAAADGQKTSANTAASVIIEKLIVNSHIQYRLRVLYRAQAGTMIDTTPSIYERLIEGGDDEHDQHVAIDFPTYRYTTTDKITTTDGDIQLDYRDLVYYQTIQSASAYRDMRYSDTGYTAIIQRSDYITWDDAEPVVYEEHVATGDAAHEYTWTFDYTGNNTEYPPEFLFGGFNQSATIDFTTKAGTGDYEYEYTDSDTTSVVDFHNTDDTSWSKTWQWAYSFLSRQNLLPTVFLDDGTAISLSDITWQGTLPQQAMLAFQVRPTSIEANKVSFTTLGYYNSGAKEVPGAVWDISVDLNASYFRVLLSLSNIYGSTTSQGATAERVAVLYDSGIKTTILEPGTLTPDTTATTVNKAHYYNTQGSIAKQHNNWRTLINSCGLVSGISHGEDEHIGTLLTEWNSISEDYYVYYTDSVFGYHSTDGRWYEIERKEGDGDIDIIFDRYIIVNTDGYWNCYDIDRKRPMHYASDFNNRVLPGVSYKDFGDTGSYAYMKTQEYSSDLTRYFVSGINSMYEVSQIAITSIQISPQPYLDIITGNESFVWCKQPSRYKPQYIEVFYGSSSDSTAAEYQYSTILYDTTSVMIKDSALIDLNAPVAIAAATQYSPNLLTEFVHTYNNKDLVRNGAFAYPIIYNETTPILSYSSGKQISGVDNIFVIQSQFYGIIGNKIVSITYDNYTIIATDAIIDITGMVYLGYLPTMAYFWSPADRCLYTFTGDANLDISMEASSISAIYSTYYNPATESIYVATNTGVVIISGKQMWRLYETNVDHIWFVAQGYFVITFDGGKKASYYAYEPELLPDSKKQRIILQSKYVGQGNGLTSTTEQIQLVLISDRNEAGEVIFSSSTFTDTGYKTESVSSNIPADSWKNGESAVVINYTPQYATGQGYKWRIESDFAISQIVQSVVSNGAGTLTRRNV